MCNVTFIVFLLKQALNKSCGTTCLHSFRGTFIVLWTVEKGTGDLFPDSKGKSISFKEAYIFWAKQMNRKKVTVVSVGLNRVTPFYLCFIYVFTWLGSCDIKLVLLYNNCTYAIIFAPVFYKGIRKKEWCSKYVEGGGCVLVKVQDSIVWD
jgi:hypothetical protein